MNVRESVQKSNCPEEISDAIDVRRARSLSRPKLEHARGRENVQRRSFAFVLSIIFLCERSLSFQLVDLGQKVAPPETVNSGLSREKDYADPLRFD